MPLFYCLPQWIVHKNARLLDIYLLKDLLWNEFFLVLLFDPNLLKVKRFSVPSNSNAVLSVGLKSVTNFLIFFCKLSLGLGPLYVKHWKHCARSCVLTLTSACQMYESKMVYLTNCLQNVLGKYCILTSLSLQVSFLFLHKTFLKYGYVIVCFGRASF